MYATFACIKPASNSKLLTIKLAPTWLCVYIRCPSCYYLPYNDVQYMCTRSYYNSVITSSNSSRKGFESDARQSVSNSQLLCHVLFEQQLLDWITGSNIGVGSSKTTTMIYFLARPLPLGAASSSSAFLFPPAALPTFKQNRSYCL